MTKTLIEINKHEIDGQGITTVSARELHEFLEVGRDFSTWIKGRVEEYKFKENQDFIVFPQIGENPNGGRPQLEYALTLDMAKELCMVEKNEKGREARLYFIECERIAKQSTSENSPEIDHLNSLINISKEAKAATVIAKAFGFKGNQLTLSVNNAVKKVTGQDCLAIMNAKHLLNEKQQRLITATELGQKLGISARAANKKLLELGVIEAHRDHRDKLYYLPTGKGKQYCELLDTNKDRSDGTPVQQLKYYDSITQVM